MRRTKFDLYQTRSPPFGRPKLSKESLARRDPKGGRGVRVYFVLMVTEGKKGDRWLRLGDLASHELSSCTVRGGQRRISQGVLTASASGAVGFSRLRFAVSAALLALQLPSWFPHHHFRHTHARGKFQAAVGVGGCGGGVAVSKEFSVSPGNGRCLRPD